ncbi:MAG TPA: hypothetical protein VJA26_09540 [Gammaproteobacteria bacterium]|nr:hypothetical protein [Gammaproteobacteria bacterium]
MELKFWLAGAILAVAGCGSSEAPNEPAADSAQNDRETVFDPLVESVDRAKSVQQTVDEQAEELRRRVEEAEGN